MPETNAALLFTDVEGSTRLRHRLGDERAHEFLRALDGLIRLRVRDHGGEIVKSLGDGLMAAFRSPSGAIEAAMDVQRTARDVGQVRLRIGIHWGPTTAEGTDLFGQSVHAAARIVGKAEGGQILVSTEVRKAAAGPPDVRYLDRGLFWLKGFPERWRLYEVVPPDGSGAAQLTHLGRTPLVGREEERAELRRMLETTEEGRGSVCLVGGEAGVGKSRFAQEVVADAERQGFRVLVGQCAETEGSPPYLPFVQIMETTIGRSTDLQALLAMLGEAAPQIARVMPGLRSRFPEIPPPPDLPPEQERRLLFNSVRDFIARAAQSRPLVLVLEDLHLADEPSLALLRHLAPALIELPVLVIGTYRDTDVIGGTPFARTLEELLRGRLARRLQLKRLSIGEAAAMLEALGGHAPPPQVVGRIYEETDGNAFFVEEVFEHLKEEGKLLDEGGRWRPDVSLRDVDIPDTVRLVIGRRLERLSEQTLRILSTAAVIGRSFELPLLLRATDVDPDTAFTALEEGEETHLIAPRESLRSGFSFVHELIRQTLLARLPSVRRQRIHLDVADALESIDSASLEERAVDLAHHLVFAGAAASPQKTHRYLLLAGTRALEASAFEDALRYLKTALEFPSTTDEQRAELEYQLGLAERSLGHWDEAIRRLNSALDTYEAVGDLVTVGRRSYEVAYQMAWAARFEDALMMVGRGLAAVGDGVSVDRGRLLALGGALFAAGGYHDAGTAVLDEAMGIAESMKDDELQAVTLANKVIQHWMYMENDVVIDLAPRAIRRLRDVGALWDLVQTLGLLAVSYGATGKSQELPDLLRELAELAEKLGNRQGMLMHHRARFTDAFASGKPETLRAMAEADLEICRSADMPWIAESYGYLAAADLFGGDWERGVERAKEAVRLEGPGVFTGWHRSILLLLYAFTGDRAGVLELLADRQIELPEPGQPNGWGRWTYGVAAAEALWAIGERKGCAELYQVAVEAAKTGTLASIFSGRLYETVSGLTAAAGSRWMEAEAHFQRALELAAEIPYPIEQAEARRLFAETLLRRSKSGDVERAAALLEEARALYRQLGMERHARITEQLLHRTHAMKS